MYNEDAAEIVELFGITETELLQHEVRLVSPTLSPSALVFEDNCVLVVVGLDDVDIVRMTVIVEVNSRQLVLQAEGLEVDAVSITWALVTGKSFPALSHLEDQSEDERNENHLCCALPRSEIRA